MMAELVSQVAAVSDWSMRSYIIFGLATVFHFLEDLEDYNFVNSAMRRRCFYLYRQQNYGGC